MITFSTVGFGDQAPKSKLGRCLGSFFMIVGVAAFGHLVARIKSSVLFWFTSCQTLSDLVYSMFVT